MLPSFQLNLGGYWFEITPEDYLVELADNICAICMTGAETLDEWVLGSVLMRGYYNIHDHGNSRIGFIPYPGSHKSAPISVNPEE